MWICLSLWYIAFSFLFFFDIWLFSSFFFFSWVLDHGFHRLHCKFWSRYPVIYCASTELGTLVSFPIYILRYGPSSWTLTGSPLLPSAKLGILGILLFPVILDLCTWNCLWGIWNYLWGESWAICKRVLHTFFFFFFNSSILPSIYPNLDFAVFKERLKYWRKRNFIKIWSSFKE